MRGVGFRVVAAEVRALAQRSKTAAIDVGRLLTEIKQATNAAVLKMETTSREVRAGAQALEQTHGTFDALGEAISRAAHLGGRLESSANQQAAGASQILATMHEIDTVSADHVTLTEQVQDVVADLDRLVLHLQAHLAAGEAS